ncbi:hypothetical protein D9M68_838050 [compost metagenome]|uniref:hypothetical protein n=1 Tax=unclassified Hydrogenophaga TaxID=2610897 RepID=UPI0006FC7AA9|nr:hypothetical protein [Hydrogenophaga sp. Root209]KRC01026.1 hypothetical protein ASE11_05135 [Hydrogenophaga sp. Root209]
MSTEQDSSRKAQASPRKTARRKHDPLLVNGVSSLVAGCGLWMLSLAMGDQATFKVASRALLAPAWMALAVGVALLLLHVVIKRRTRFEAAMLLRQHSRFHEPMPPVLNLPKINAKAPAARRKRPRAMSAE